MEIPIAKQLWDLCDHPVKPVVFKAALELEVWAKIEAGHHTAEAIAPLDAIWLFAVTRQGDTYTFPQWKSFLVETGFVEATHIQLSGRELIRARKP